MRVLFISDSCSEEKYKQIFSMRNKKIIDPQQKFCNLLINGISKNKDVNEDCMSALLVSASTVNKKKFEKEIERVDDTLTYYYLPFINGKVLRYLTLYQNSRRFAASWIKKYNNEDLVIICDALAYSICRPVQNLARKHHIKMIAIVTDLPLLATDMKQRSEPLIKKISRRIIQTLIDKSLKDYDAYIPLTESINDYVNKTHKPSIVIEGSVDVKELGSPEIKNKKRILLYAGGIYEKYGIKNLVEAFLIADHKDYELHIYGEGSYVPELLEISKKHSCIKYMGMVSLDEIVALEKEASILINPRPSNEKFSKYSFPSKTLEYMASRTPLLTTRLPGIPQEYFNYVYTFCGENIQEMAESISNVIGKDESELARTGNAAFTFVIENKNNIAQGKKIVDFAYHVINN